MGPRCGETPRTAMLSSQVQGVALGAYSPPEVDGIWSIRGSYYNTLKAVFYLLKGDYIFFKAGDLIQIRMLPHILTEQSPENFQILAFQCPGLQHMHQAAVLRYGVTSRRIDQLIFP